MKGEKNMARKKRPVVFVPDAEAEAPATEDTARAEMLRAKIKKLLQHRERAKKEYGRSGALLNQLVREMRVGETVALDDGRQATMVDAFAKQNYAYRNTSFTRCDIDVTG